jgi:hypothetical protein
MSVYRVLRWICPPVSRVLFFCVTSICYQYRVNASGKHRVFSTFNFKSFLLRILMYTICAKYAKFGGTLLETSANNPDFYSCSWKISVERTQQFSECTKFSLLFKDQPFHNLLIIIAYFTLISKIMHSKSNNAASRLSILDGIEQVCQYLISKDFLPTLLKIHIKVTFGHIAPAL